MSAAKHELSDMERSILSLLVTAVDAGRAELTVRDIGQAIYGGPPGANSAEYFRIRNATESLLKQNLISKVVRNVHMRKYENSRVSYFSILSAGRSRLSSTKAGPSQGSQERACRDGGAGDPGPRATCEAEQGGALADPPALSAARRRLRAGCSPWREASGPPDKEVVGKLIQLASRAWTDGHWSEKYPIVRFPVEWNPTGEEISFMMAFLADLGIRVVESAWNLNRREVRLLLVN